MDMIEKTNLVIEIERLRSFLENNQLVQANAIVQKVEGMLQTVVAKESTTTLAENHPLWKPFRCSVRIKREILSGNTRAAETEAENIAIMLRGEDAAPKKLTISSEP